MRSLEKQSSLALILSNIGGLIALMFSTTFFTGMLFWLIGKRGRGKGGGTITSVAVSIVLIVLYQKGFNMGSGEIFLLIFITFLLGIFTVQPAEQFMLEKWGERRRHTGKIVTRDFNETSMDEAHGMLIAVLPIYFFKLELIPFLIFQVIALAAFRIFDVWKPWPIRTIEAKCDPMFSLDIMLDDTAAGIMAMLVVCASMVIKSYL